MNICAEQNSYRDIKVEIQFNNKYNKLKILDRYTDRDSLLRGGDPGEFHFAMFCDILNDNVIKQKNTDK